MKKQPINASKLIEKANQDASNHDPISKMKKQLDSAIINAREKIIGGNPVKDKFANEMKKMEDLVVNKIVDKPDLHSYYKSLLNADCFTVGQDINTSFIGIQRSTYFHVVNILKGKQKIEEKQDN